MASRLLCLAVVVSCQLLAEAVRPELIPFAYVNLFDGEDEIKSDVSLAPDYGFSSNYGSNNKNDELSVNPFKFIETPMVHKNKEEIKEEEWRQKIDSLWDGFLKSDNKKREQSEEKTGTLIGLADENNKTAESVDKIPPPAQSIVSQPENMKLFEYTYSKSKALNDLKGKNVQYGVSILLDPFINLWTEAMTNFANILNSFLGNPRMNTNCPADNSLKVLSSQIHNENTGSPKIIKKRDVINVDSAQSIVRSTQETNELHSSQITVLQTSQSSISAKSENHDVTYDQELHSNSLSSVSESVTTTISEKSNANGNDKQEHDINEEQKSNLDLLIASGSTSLVDEVLQEADLAEIKKHNRASHTMNIFYDDGERLDDLIEDGLSTKLVEQPFKEQVKRSVSTPIYVVGGILLMIFVAASAGTIAVYSFRKRHFGHSRNQNQQSSMNQHASTAMA